MKLLAPAKVNLHLKVGRVRADGFHPLVSWFCSIGLFDEITLNAAEGFGFTLTCSDPSLPTDERNLLYRAARGVGFAGAAYLEKRIPMGAGLGGGSADAGRMVLAAKDALAPGRAEKIAAGLGSDVMFFVTGEGSAICSGRGEVVRPVKRPRPRWVVLVLPGVHVGTPGVYRRFDEMGLGSELREEDWGGWAELAAEELMSRVENDLEAAAFAVEPGLGELRARVERAAGRTVRMSGSGSSLFTLADTQEEAEELAGRVRREMGGRVEVCELCPAVGDDLALGW